ncbi:MAG: hypothetical protein HOZ81_32410 [Streptomyces sp.]|nr:hypothetical protein [Streptomyces sp.]
MEAMSRHLIEDVAVGWDELGTDLLDGAPPSLAAALTGGEQWRSRTLDHLITLDGTPPRRMSVTDETADQQDMQWGYVLHQQGIEVISLLHEDLGPIVSWATDPRTAFNDDPTAWSSLDPAPAVRAHRNTPPPSTPTTAPARVSASRRTTPR